MTKKIGVILFLSLLVLFLGFSQSALVERYLTAANNSYSQKDYAKAFDYIIIDLPPINAVSDGLAVSKLLSGMIMVVRQDYCDQHSLAEAMRQLEFLKIKLLGFVLNGADSQSNRYRSKKIRNSTEC